MTLIWARRWPPSGPAGNPGGPAGRGWRPARPGSAARAAWPGPGSGRAGRAGLRTGCRPAAPGSRPSSVDPVSRSVRVPAGFRCAPSRRWSATDSGGVSGRVLGDEADPGQLRPGRRGPAAGYLDGARRSASAGRWPGAAGWFSRPRSGRPARPRGRPGRTACTLSGPNSVAANGSGTVCPARGLRRDGHTRSFRVSFR